MLRLPPYTVLSFHSIETNGMLDPGPFHLLPQISFSNPFNLDGSFHPTVCALSWKHNGYQSVALSDRQTFICWEAHSSWKAFCYLSLRWLNDFFLWFVPCHFSPSHWKCLFHTFHMWQNNPVSLLLDPILLCIPPSNFVMETMNKVMNIWTVSGVGLRFRCKDIHLCYKVDIKCAGTHLAFFSNQCTHFTNHARCKNQPPCCIWETAAVCLNSIFHPCKKSPFPSVCCSGRGHGSRLCVVWVAALGRNQSLYRL